MIPRGLPQQHENKDVADEIFENRVLSSHFCGEPAIVRSGIQLSVQLG